MAYFHDNQKRNAFLFQVYFGILANISALSPGMTLSFPAVTIPQMKNQSNEFYVSEDEASWIASLASIATPIGCFAAGPLIDIIGRQKSILVLNIPGLIGWACIAFSSGPYTLYFLYAGRIITGIALGMLNSPLAVFMSEISRDRVRGMLISWTSVSFSAGMVIVLILGSIFPDDWKIVARICMAFPILSIATAWFLPESPSWLITKNRSVEAEKCFKRIRGIPKDSEIPPCFVPEFQSIMKNKIVQSVEKESLMDTFAEFKKPSAWKPLLIMILLFAFQQFSGVYAILAYTVDVLDQFGVEVNPYYIAAVIGFTRLVVTCLQGYLSMKFGRRKLIIFSGVTMYLLLTSLFMFLLLRSSGILHHGQLTWLPIILFMLLISAGAVGFLSLPWSMVGEVFPLKIRGSASGITLALAQTMEFMVIKYYPAAVAGISLLYVFLIFSIVMLIGIVFVVHYLPETQGKTLLEIEESFSKRKTYGT